MQHLNTEFGLFYGGMLSQRVDRLVTEPKALKTLVEAVAIYHKPIEVYSPRHRPALDHGL